MSAILPDSHRIIDRLILNSVEQSKLWMELPGALILSDKPYRCARSQMDGEVDLMIHASGSKDECALWFSEKEQMWYFPPQLPTFDTNTGQKGVETGFILPNAHNYHIHPYHLELMNSIDSSVEDVYNKLKERLKAEKVPVKLLQNMVRAFESLRIMCATVVPSLEDINTMQNWQRYGYPPASMRIASGYGITTFNSVEVNCLPVEKIGYESNIVKCLFEIVQLSFEKPFSNAEAFVRHWFQKIEGATQLELKFNSLKSYEAYFPWLVEKVRQKR